MECTRIGAETCGPLYLGRESADEGTRRRAMHWRGQPRHLTVYVADSRGCRRTGRITAVSDPWGDIWAGNTQRSLPLVSGDG
jgi:hypothetical protein